jgi:hypothetical protein
MVEWEECPYCGHREKDFLNFIVGFSNSEDILTKSTWGENILWGAEALECPVCFENSWRHTKYRNPDTFSCLVGEGKIVLRVPGADEAFHTMLEMHKQKE